MRETQYMLSKSMKADIPRHKGLMCVYDHSVIPKWHDIPIRKWKEWHWQVKNAIRTVEDLREVLDPELSENDAKMVMAIDKKFEMKVTPHTALTIYNAFRSGDQAGAKALLAAFVPSINEETNSENNGDSIGEELECSKPAPLVANFYKTRVLLFTTNVCASYCRFCFRRRKVGDGLSRRTIGNPNSNELRKAIEYIKRNKTIREVIVSGGDPLTLSDRRLLTILRQLKGIDHVKVLRINTKVPTTLPQRITPQLISGLKELKPIYIVVNFLHPAELTPEAINATALFVDAGIPVFSHTALLKGINSDAEIISELMWNLYINRINPYYLIHFIPTKSTEHFRVSIEKGLEVMEYLHGRLSGIANPTYIVYLPDGGGKVPLLPNYLFDRTDEGYVFKNFEGKRILYKEPGEI